MYLSTDRVLNVRKELLKAARPRSILCVYCYFSVDVPIHLHDSARHVYVESILCGETEGKFLEDPEAHRDELMGQVSKLGGFRRCMAIRETNPLPSKFPVYWTHADIDREVKDITPMSRATLSLPNMASLVSGTTYYRHLLLARSAREANTREMREMEQEGKQAEAEYDRNLAILIDRIQSVPNASAADRAGWEQEIKKLQGHVVVPIC